MRIAERDVGNRDGTAARAARRMQLIFGHRDVLIRQRRSPDGAKVIQLYDQASLHAVKIADFGERASLPVLRTLSVTRVQQ